MCLNEHAALARVVHQPRSRWVSLLGAATLVSQAGAHPLLVSRGEAVVSTDGVAMELEVAAEDFLHHYRVAVDADGRYSLPSLRVAAERHAEMLQRRFVICGADGECLAGEPVCLRWDWDADGVVPLHDLRKMRARYTRALTTGTPPRFLTFRLINDGAGSAIPWQILLSVRGAEQHDGSAVRLTSGGNAETIELTWRDQQAAVMPASTRSAAQGACAPDELRGTARFKEVFADIAADEEGINVDVFIPLPLLETWASLPRRSEDSLTADEQQAALPIVLPTLQQAVFARVSGTEVPGEVVQLRFLPIEAPIRHPQRMETGVSLWTGRLAVRLRFRTARRPEEAVLRWNLFNGAVLAARAAIHAKGPCTEHVFSTHDPTYTWRREP